MFRAATLALVVLAPLLAGCDDDPDPALVRAVRSAAAPALYAPEIDGDGPRSFLVNTVDDSVTLDYGKGFTPTLTLRAAPTGDLCAARDRAEWDQCTAIDEDAVHLSFEEMDAVAVRRDGTELFWSNLSFEVADEDYPSDEAIREAMAAQVDRFVTASREADELTPAAFVSAVPKGKVGQP